MEKNEVISISSILNTIKLYLFDVVVDMADEETNNNIWKNLQFFWGKWNGIMDGREAEVKREYHLIMDTHYIYIKNMGINKDGTIEFKDIGFINCDSHKRRYILRVYSSSGRVFEFELKNIENNGGKIIWETTHIENFPGWKAKIDEKITGKKEFDEIFYMKKDDEDYKIYMKTHFKK